MKDINYFRAKGSYSRAGAEAKKKAKQEAEFADSKGPGEEGTDELVKNYKKATPGQSVAEAMNDDEMVHSAAKKPTKVVRNGKEITVMRPEKMKIQTEAAIKLRSQNDVRAMLFDFVSEYIDRESMPNLMKLAKVIGKKLKKDGSSFMIESVLDEKTLTPAELKKREEIAKSIERDNPDMPMDKKMAIATAAAKRVAEMNFHQFRNQLTEAQKECHHCEGKGYHMEDGKKMECPECDGTGMIKESVEQLDESVAKAYEIMKPTKSMNHGIEAIKKHMKVDHGTATNLAKQVMDKVKKGEFKEGYYYMPSKKQIGRASDEPDMPSSNRVKLRGFGTQQAKGNMGDSTARASLKPKKPTNEGMDNPPFTPDPPKPQAKNSDGTTTKPMSRAKQLAQKAMKKKTMGEAKSFDQKFKDHLKFATSSNPAVSKYLAKRQDQRRAQNAKMDPGADKKGLALTVVDRQKAYAKGKKKGIGVMDIDTRPGKDHATGKSTYGKKLPK